MSTLVAYFSRAGQNYGHGGVIDLPKGNTEILAEAMAADLGAPLCTNEGSGLGGSVGDLRRSYPAANVVEGLSVRGTDAESSTRKAVAWAKKAIA